MEHPLNVLSHTFQKLEVEVLHQIRDSSVQSCPFSTSRFNQGFYRLNHSELSIKKLAIAIAQRYVY